MNEPAQNGGIMQHFVLREARSKQLTALEYIERKYADGFDNIVVSAPTGIGKSAIGATTCFWSSGLPLEAESGGYYLVGQKLLQDQLQRDLPQYRVRDAERRCASLKSAVEYSCQHHGTCAYGLGRKTACACVRDGTCTYLRARAAFGAATMAVTNYPYLFTEHQFVNKLKPRKVLVLDECHSLERQILKFIEVSITQKSLKEWTPTIKEVPEFEDVEEFAGFLAKEYLPILQGRLDMLENWEATDDSPESRKQAQEKVDLQNHYSRTKRGADLIREDPHNWVFWQEEDRHGDMEALAKPLDASPFGQELVFEMGKLRIFMSAYPGSKNVFCRSLGLEPGQVAWLNLNSTFPVENRQIYLTTVGSMSRRNREETMPAFIKFATTILNTHRDTKGIIHCHSYELGESIHRALLATEHASRLFFPRNADDREPVFRQHRLSKAPTVIITPSMTEGFDFAEDLARWQIISKVPYPYLGDRQVSAKKEMDADWYDLQAVSSIIQACGRICRSETDVGQTYVLDSDFLTLFERQQEMFPRWWTDALVWPKRRQR